MKESTHEKLKRFNSWAAEAQWASSEWREQSWRDCEMMDGAQWSQTDMEAAKDAGIDMVTINRTFPTVNLILGSEAINRKDIIAKARTHKDSELSQVMTEGLKFIMDQSNGSYLISQAFRDQIIPGVGWLAPVLSSDPRQERLQVKPRDWKEVWWDPFSSPWLNPQTTRYAFWQRWIDLEDLQAVFWRQKKDIEEAYQELTGRIENSVGDSGYFMDEAETVEEHIRTLAASDWADTNRRRVRPIEMYYPITERCLFALFPDGRWLEIKKDMDPRQATAVVDGGAQLIRANVKKMQTCTFLGEHLLLQDMPTPYPHDEFPLVPFIGYLDRYKFPYGVPRQIRGQDEEVNKRRSMALALLKSRRVIIEKTAVANGDEKLLQAVYEEANKLDSFIVLEGGGLDRFKLVEMQDLSPAQIALLDQSEREIQQISGTNAEMLGYESNAESGVAKQKMINQGLTINAPLFDNEKRSLKMLGEQIGANMQRFWNYEKVLRITDNLTGAERYVELNKHVQRDDGAVEVKNDITQGKFDFIITDAPVTDTVREKNIELLIEWVKKSPPEIIPHLMMAAMEMSNLPNKEALLAKIKPLLGEDPGDENLSPEEIKAKVQQTLEAQRQQAQLQQQIEMENVKLELNKKRLENEKIKAEITKILAEAAKKADEADIAEEKQRIEVEEKALAAVEKGIGIVERLNNPQGQDGEGKPKGPALRKVG